MPLVGRPGLAATPGGYRRPIKPSVVPPREVLRRRHYQGHRRKRSQLRFGRNNVLRRP
jgi:hypothetical protein